MNFLVSNFKLFLSQKDFYLQLKTNFKRFAKMYNQNDVLMPIRYKSAEIKGEYLKNDNSKTLIKSYDDHNRIILQRSLRQLEFIAQLEFYLQEKRCDSYSIEFLQEFETVKRKTQQSVIKSTCKLCKCKLVAA